MTRTRIVHKLEERLRELLLRIPRLEVLGKSGVSEGGEEPETASSGIVQVLSPSGAMTRMVLKAISAASPREARIAAFEWRRESDANASALLVLGGLFLSEATLAVCEEEGLGAVDLSGNCHLAFDNVYLSIRGRRNLFPRSIEKPTLSSRKTARIIRVLLTDPKRRWLGKDLAAEAEVSPAFVTNLRDYFLKQEWITEESRHWHVIRPEGMIRAWAHEEERKKPVRVQYYSPHDPESATKRMAQAAVQMRADLAFTEFGGLQMFMPYTTSSRVTAYLGLEDHKWREFEKVVGLKRVDSGGNVHLLKPRDGGVFYKTDRVGDIVRWVSPIQHYVDLVRAGERGEDAAEFILEEYIKKTW